jgi:hypothetical protein
MEKFALCRMISLNRVLRGGQKLIWAPALPAGRGRKPCKTGPSASTAAWSN